MKSPHSVDERKLEWTHTSEFNGVLQNLDLKVAHIGHRLLTESSIPSFGDPLIGMHGFSTSYLTSSAVSVPSWSHGFLFTIQNMYPVFSAVLSIKQQAKST